MKISLSPGKRERERASERYATLESLTQNAFLETYLYRGLLRAPFVRVSFLMKEHFFFFSKNLYVGIDAEFSLSLEEEEASYRSIKPSGVLLVPAI